MLSGNIMIVDELHPSVEVVIASFVAKFGEGVQVGQGDCRDAEIEVRQGTALLVVFNGVEFVEFAHKLYLNNRHSPTRIVVVTDEGTIVSFDGNEAPNTIRGILVGLQEEEEREEREL